MQLIDSIISLLSKALAALVVFVAMLLPAPAGYTVATPQPAPTAATSTGNTSREQFPAAQTAAPQKAAPTPKADAVEKPVAPPAPQTPAVQIPLKSQEQINVETRSALVNILCLAKTGLHGISGSGIIVDSRGVILTNAHIGQYLLLRDYLTAGNVDCTIRIGSPAERRYRATLLYLPPAWIADNASQLVASQASGSGQNDYAFLLIDSTTNPQAALPTSFARVEMSRTYPDIGEEMLLASYPAGFLASELIEKSLYASSAVTYVTRLFAFGDNVTQVDLFSIGGTVLSQAGSSGGAVVRLGSGKLAGLIATATVAASTGERDLRAVTLSHIDESLALQGMGGIIALLSGDLAAKAAAFEATLAPAERAALIKILGGN